MMARKSSWLPTRILIVALAAQTVAVCSANAQVVLPPENMAKVQAAAIRLYADLEHDDWAGSMEQLQSISKAAAPIISRLDGPGAPLVRAIVRTFRAVHQHDHIAALHAANKIREWSDLETASMRPDTPLEVTRLGYLARELQIESVEYRHKKTVARILEVRRCWDQLKPVLEKSGDPALVKDGEAVVHQLELADTADDLKQTLVQFSRWVERIGEGFGGKEH